MNSARRVLSLMNAKDVLRKAAAFDAFRGVLSNASLLSEMGNLNEASNGERCITIPVCRLMPHMRAAAVKNDEQFDEAWTICTKPLDALVKDMGFERIVKLDAHSIQLFVAKTSNDSLE